MICTCCDQRFLSGSCEIRKLQAGGPNDGCVFNGMRRDGRESREANCDGKWVPGRIRFNPLRAKRVPIEKWKITRAGQYATYAGISSGG